MPSSDFTLSAFLGTHQVTIDVAIDRDTASGIDHFLTDGFRARWLRDHFPEFVPGDNANGSAPSERTISRHFCSHYWLNKKVRRAFLDTYEKCDF